jgi:hypothetical protein
MTYRLTHASSFIATNRPPKFTEEISRRFAYWSQSLASNRLKDVAVRPVSIFLYAFSHGLNSEAIWLIHRDGNK